MTARRTAGRTVITAVPEISEDGSAAEMVATPVATPVTRPVDDTDAVESLEDDHVTELVRSLVLKSE